MSLVYTANRTLTEEAGEPGRGFAQILWRIGGKILKESIQGVAGTKLLEDEFWASFQP